MKTTDTTAHRFRWEPDTDFDPASDPYLADEIREAWVANEVTAEGCILEVQCEHCGEWRAVESLWGIVEADPAYRARIESELLDEYERTKGGAA